MIHCSFWNKISSAEYSGRGDGGAGGAKAPPLFAKMKFAHLYFTVLR